MKLKKRFLQTLFIGLLFGVIFNSCIDDAFVSKEDMQLVFSSDTVFFDTVFTTIGSTTKSFRVINPYSQRVAISEIQLAGGDASSYRLNIDGLMQNSMTDIELAPYDSIYIFVEITVDPNGANQPMIVQDSIIFTVNKSKQDVDLRAWGQDIVPYWNNEVIGNTTWTAEKPYLIMDTVLVDSNAVLTIEPGAQIFFHKDAMLAAIGNIQARGEIEMPIVFKGSRLEKMYDDIPDQWHGILLLPNEGLNVFENVDLRGAKIGIQSGAVEVEGSSNLSLHNVRIQHMSFAGIFALKANITATNTLIADCRQYAAALLLGGSYDFNHCTIANYWSGFSNRESESLVISNVLSVQAGEDPETNALEKASWRNSIIWGNLNDEINLVKADGIAFNVAIENSIYRLGDSIYNANQGVFSSSFRNEDPQFIDYPQYNFELDTLSPAKDRGALEFGYQVPFDLNDVNRVQDEGPDLGVFERVE